MNQYSESSPLINYQDKLEFSPLKHPEPDEKKIDYIVHKVSPGDTLIGISLQYHVPEIKIKQFNDLDSDEIYFKKEIKIPNPQTNFVSQQIDLEQQIKFQKINFLRFSVLNSQDQCDQVAKYYLEEGEWDLKKAESIYKQDLQWEEGYKSEQNPTKKPDLRKNQVIQMVSVDKKNQ